MSDYRQEGSQEATENIAPSENGATGLVSRTFRLPLKVVRFLWNLVFRQRVADDSSRNVIPTRHPSRTGNTIPLESLAPKYQREHHEVYLDLLERALQHPNTRNIALTGAYGSGKSSVLRELSRTQRRRKIIELSLSTLDPTLVPAIESANKAEAERSNRIQKELVKQLLYQLPPWKTPHSRFQRASRPSKWTGIKVAFTAAIVVGLTYVVSVLAGWQVTVAQRVANAGWDGPLFWIALSVGPVLLAVFAWLLIAGRYTVKAGVEASALSVSLEPTSSSYFDQYLDEIMYFFQISKTEVVLIEDVDRFDDAVVFDTLRALNSLVNNSGQVNRRIVFVYAIRDSVLGKIGTKKSQTPQAITADATGLGPDEEQQTIGMSRANRAKYFDVIIPLVPFISTDNARDLMMRIMDPHVAEPADSEGISPSLIRLVARHVADMRTIRSIRNEFEIHRDRLMGSAENPMPEINDDIVLSLVLLRATCPDAYEEIRLSQSPLDDLVKRWNALVEANISIQTKNLTERRTQLENSNSRETRAKQVGERLNSLRSLFLSLPTNFAADKVQFFGPLTEDDLGSSEGWQKIANGESLSLRLSQVAGYYNTTTDLRLDRQLLESILGISIDPAEWKVEDEQSLIKEIASINSKIGFLRHHTWAGLYSAVDFTVEANPDEQYSEGGQICFKGLVKNYAPSPLAHDLIENGYLPRHFARYSSVFYGAVVSPNAAEYISRAIEPGTPILEYELTDDDVSKILLEQTATSDSADLFDDQSIYNLDIVSYLLTHRPIAAQRVATHLATRWEGPEQEFVSRFLQRREHEESGKLVALMTQSWSEALQFTVIDAEITPKTRLHLVDAVLGAVTHESRHGVNQNIGAYLADNYTKLNFLSKPEDQNRASIVMKVVAEAEGMIHNLAILNQAALEAAAQLNIYPLTPGNLHVLGGVENVSLDALRERPDRKAVYAYVLKKIDDYLDALPQLEPAEMPIFNPDEFSSTLNDVAESASGISIDRFVAATSLDCRIPNLDDINSDAWTAVITHDRSEPTFANISRYVREYGIDQALGEFLSTHCAITDMDGAVVPERLSLATKILKARNEIHSPEIRVKLVASLKPGIIPISQLVLEDANLIGPLLKAKLLEDTPDTFNPAILINWEYFELAVASSDEFGNFADATIMPIKNLAKVLRSEAISEETKAKIIYKLDEFLPNGSATQAGAVTWALIERQEVLDLSRLESLRRAGVSTDSLVRLINIQAGALSTVDLRSILSAMGGDYKRVSEGGIGVVRFGPGPDHEALLKRLEGVTHTGAVPKTTMLHGMKLQANLKRATT